MFFVAGTDNRTTTMGRGTFFCPTCDQERSYEHKIVKQPTTVFFVPVMSLGKLGQVRATW